MAATATKWSLFIFVCLLLQFVGLLSFLYNFTHLGKNMKYRIMKRQGGGRAVVDHSSKLINSDVIKKATTSSEENQRVRVVLMVIDALRADYIPGDACRTPFICKSLRESKRAVHYNAVVQSPTVTMPRIKAITAGIVPSFSDFILNFISTELHEDNVISALKTKREIFTFFGDDTWLKLFPNHFRRFDGTNSFVVNDFYEVDNNVTRHLDEELKQQDWRLMILHYLGLDHIGHHCGLSKCPDLRNRKLLEMDQIVEKIYNRLSQDNGHFYLFVFGDHGMTAVGTHGGSSHAETMVPVVVLSSNEFVDVSSAVPKIQQLDLAPTLATLLNVDLPKNSLGVVIDHVTRSFVSRDEHVLAVYQRNAEQLLLIYEMNHAFSDASEIIFNLTQLRKAYVQILGVQSEKMRSLFKSTAEGYRHLLKHMQSNLMQYLSQNYDDFSLLCSITVCWFGYTCLLFAYYRTYLRKTDLFNNYFLFTASLIILHTLSLGSTSFVEEEHQTFYYLMITLILMAAWKSIVAKMFTWKICFSTTLILALHRLLRAWNRTGDKWHHLEDVDDWLSKDENMVYLATISSITTIFGYLYVLKSARYYVCKLLIFLGSICVYIYRYETVLAGNDGLILAKLVYAFFVLLLLFSIWKKDVTSLLAGFFLISTILTKFSSNCIPPLLILIDLFLCKLYKSANFSKLEALTVQYVFAACSYFYVGNSNSLSYIDVSAGYVGMQSYIPVITGSLIALDVYCCPILVVLLFIRRQCHRAPDNNSSSLLSLTVVDHSKFSLSSVAHSLLLFTILKCAPVNFYLLIAFVQRHHLFVWSVVAPKLLYECCHMIISYAFYFFYCLNLF